MSANAARSIVSIGVNWYPDGIYVVPYALGVRAPFPNAAQGSPQESYNTGYAQGAYDASWRVGLAGLAAGALLGYLLFRR